MRRSARLFAWLLALAFALSCARAVLAEQAPADIQHRLHEASVNVGGGCSGVLTEGQDLVVTARHCVTGKSVLDVRFSNGLVRPGYVAATDEVADQAVLLLETPVSVTPLSLLRGAPIDGTVLFFEGNPRDPRFQEAKLDHSGTCPSLPQLSNALFTTIRGVPGDSGSPLVDAGGHVVGLVHGGAQCAIATPANTLVRLIDRVLGPGEVQVSRAPAPPGVS
ncbi:MAG TPA: serine protease [Candidatus Binatia bacterium]|jgi:S1-C subfamily serine protease